MMQATGSCAGIENYSRYLTGRNPGEPPPTLFEYLPENALLFVDESHVTVPQLGGMFRGDFNRKSVLAEYGFRLPSCVDNRPLKFEEWETYRPQTMFVSATPGPWEMERTGGAFIEQVIRPTGLIDPVTEVRPVEHQVDDLLAECRTVAAAGARVLLAASAVSVAAAMCFAALWALGEFPRQAHHRTAGAGTAGRGPFDWNSLPRAGSGPRNDPGGVAGRKSFRGEPP